MKIKKLLIKNSLFLILFLAAILRLWNLGGNPPHLTPDEASIGYNAYSILKTGRDEYGELLPIIFKSFGDYKPGLYIYTVVPSVAIFGLTEFAIRLPSAIAGVFAVWLLYKVVYQLFSKKSFPFNTKYFALTTSFLLAISPWHIHFSRGAWEVNLSFTLTLAGIYFFLKSFNKPKNLTLSAIFFALTLITYQGAKLSTGIVMLIFGIVYWKDITKWFKKERKPLILGLFFGLIISLPIIMSMFTGKAGRLTVFSVFSYPRSKEYVQAMLDHANESIGDINYLLFHAEGFNYVRGILGRWFNHYSDKFLFFQGDWPNPRHSAPNHGMLLLGELVIIVIGIIAMLRNSSRETRLVWLWLLLAPLPSILSRDQVHAIRAHNMLVPLMIILTFGIFYIVKLAQKQKLIIKVTSLLLLVGLYVGSYIYFLDAYFVHLPMHNSKYWEYGYKQIVEIVTPIQGNYKTVRFQQSFAQPYIYFLFYQKYDPAKYQEQAKLVSSGFEGDVGYVVKLDNIEFVPIDWSIQRGESGVLFIADIIRIPPVDSVDEELFNIIADIKYLYGGQTAFRIIEVK